MKNFIIFIAFVSFTACKKDNSADVLSTTYKDTAFTAVFKRTTGIIAADGGNSIPLNNGKSLWIFGDSYIGNYDAATKTVPCLFQVRNAGILMDIQNPSPSDPTLTGTGSPASYLSLGTNNAYWFWPGAGYQNGDTIFTFSGRIHSTGGGGGFGFEEVDSLYVSTIPVQGMQEIKHKYLGSKNNISFGTGVVQNGGYVYVYGIRDNGFGRDVFVARYLQNGIYGPWEYFGNNGWNTDILQIKKLASGFTSSFHVSKVENKYIMMSTEFSVGCDQGKKIYVQSADSPSGPFSEKQVVWEVKDSLQGHLPVFYNAVSHPEYSSREKGLLVTYCINGYGTCVQSCVNGRLDPNVYRLQAIRIPYASVGL